MRSSSLIVCFSKLAARLDAVVPAGAPAKVLPALLTCRRLHLLEDDKISDMHACVIVNHAFTSPFFIAIKEWRLLHR